MGKKSKAMKAAPKRKSVGDKASRPTKKPPRFVPSAADLAWKSVFIQGEAFHTAAVANIHRGPECLSGQRVQWDFSHFLPQLKSLLAEYPGFNVFVFGGSPQPFDFDNEKNIKIKGIHPMPTLNIILMPQGHMPPPFIAIRRGQQGTTVVQPMESLNLTWNSEPSWAGEDLQDRVSILTCKSRKTKAAFNAQEEHDLFTYEYALLYFMRPSVDWQMEKNDPAKMSVRHCMFEYPAGDGEMLSEEFDRDLDRMGTFVPDFLERNDLDEEHEELVKNAIKSAFESARAEKQAKKDMLKERGYDANVLESVKVVKLYPKNPFVTEEHKDPRVNEYYGRAFRVV